MSINKQIGPFQNGDPIISDVKALFDDPLFKKKVLKAYNYTLNKGETGNPDLMFQLIVDYLLEISNFTRDVMMIHVNKEIQSIERVYKENKIDACLDTILLLKRINDLRF